MTLNKKNKDELEAMVDLAQELGTNNVGFGGTIPTPWNQHLLLNDEESLHLWETANELREKTGFDIRTVSALYTRGGVNFCGILNLHELTINSRGELMFCCDTIENGAVIGSLTDKPFSPLVEEWLEQSSALQRQRAKEIASGKMGQGYDTCAYCNSHFAN